MRINVTSKIAEMTGKALTNLLNCEAISLDQRIK
jgi:hypothetical protein